jgi:hypothetical protein
MAEIAAVAFTSAAEHVYDESTAQAIELDAQGSRLYFFPSLFSSEGAHARLLGQLEASLAHAQSRPHAFGLEYTAAAAERGHQQWFAAGPTMRANSRYLFQNASVPPC